MTTSIVIAMVTLTYLLAGLIGIELGVTTTAIDLPSPPISPDVGGGFFDNIRAILVGFVWTFNVLGSTFQLMTFQADIPPLASLIMTTPILVIVFFTIVRLVRGVG